MKAAGAEGTQASEYLSKNAAMLRKSISINCWYANSYESAAMWKMYAGVGDSIAIRSSVGRLQDALSKDSRRVFIGKIKYIDYRKDSIELGNIFSPYLRKRKSFEHESEVRLILWSFQKEHEEFGA